MSCVRGEVSESGGTETSITIRDSSQTPVFEGRPIAMVKEKSSAILPGRSAPAAEITNESFQDEGPTEKAESQKLQARTLEGNTAPHCKQVFVTGKFCAADASTPVRRERSKNTIYLKMSSRQNRGMVTKETAG